MIAPRPARETHAHAHGWAFEALPQALLRAGPRAAAVTPPAMRGLAETLPEARRADFLAGRAWAARALLALGVAAPEVGRSAAGLPQWPAGVCGSIAHDTQRAAAVVAHTRDWQALGVDVEPFAPLPADAAPVVLTAAEHGRLQAAHANPLHYARLPFAAKECVHKALHPLTGTWLEFDEVEIGWSNPASPAGDWQLQPLSDAARGALAGLQARGRWWRDAAGWLVVLGLRGR